MSTPINSSIAMSAHSSPVTRDIEVSTSNACPPAVPQQAGDMIEAFKNAAMKIVPQFLMMAQEQCTYGVSDRQVLTKLNEAFTRMHQFATDPELVGKVVTITVANDPKLLLQQPVPEGGHLQNRTEVYPHPLHQIETSHNLSTHGETPTSGSSAIVMANEGHTKASSSGQETLVPKWQLQNAEGKIQSQHSQLQKLTQQLQEHKNEADSLKKELYGYKQRREGHYRAHGIMHSRLQQDYARIFIYTSPLVKSLTKSGAVDAKKAKCLISQLFELAYEECKVAILLLLFEDVFQKHKDADANEALQHKVEAFGDALLSSSLPEVPPNMSNIIATLTKRIPETFKQQDGNMTRGLHEFIREATCLAWKMVTLQPPIVIDVPQTFDEEFHEPQFPYWDENMLCSEYQIECYRPALFHSCMGELAEKAWVAMEKSVTS